MKITLPIIGLLFLVCIFLAGRNTILSDRVERLTRNSARADSLYKQSDSIEAKTRKIHKSIIRKQDSIIHSKIWIAIDKALNHK